MLDLGCGLGAKANELQGRGWSIVGLDVSASRLRMASQAGFSFEKIVADASALPFRAASFDNVLVASVLTYCNRTADIVREIGRVTAPNGYLLIFEFDANNPLVRKYRGWNSKISMSRPALLELISTYFLVAKAESNIGLVPHRLLYWMDVFSYPRLFFRFMYRVDHVLTSLPFLRFAGLYFRIHGTRNSAPSSFELT